MTIATADLVADAFAWVWSIGFLFGLVKVIRLIVQSRRRTSRTTGTVVRVVTRGASVIVPSPDVEFVDSHGIEHLFKSTFGTSWNQWPVGCEWRSPTTRKTQKIVNLHSPIWEALSS